ncbi:hypothetical protein J2Y88_004220 [Pseudomonas chlororaphis]|uniref:hypothetical protein n=1 Tax=Pseudomonas chlororaphis TaxID=587753 RepID=UPI00209CCFFC|nr:hypothetical protein [Pseudomonas chlororaphis]MCP1481909.1 hypothetical protein [Pseudomonas chlororaphis]MCP1597732.1 hypothetical protein [Pseudomonas chlororaphis]
MAETTTSKVEKWAYPLKAEASEVTDLMQYYKALAKAKDGYYPLGSNGLWHGGIHFDEDTGLVADKAEVRCIADGEVVAYRIDEKYPTSNYGSTPSVFSTGFVLVKHRLELPAPPAPAGSPPPAAGPSLTFFSLYMHLLDWEGYKANPTLKRPAFWGKDTYQVKANAPDKSLGLRVRSGNSGQTSVLTVLPRGTTVNTKPAPATQKWLEIVSVTPEVAALPANTGWVFKGEMQHLSGDIYFVGEQAKDAPPEQKTGANIRSATARGLPIGFLPTGTQIKISNEQASGKYRKLLEIVTGESIPALTPGADGTLPGYVWLDSLEAKSEPKTPGVIVPLTPVHKIRAGELIGHVGKYQNHSDPAPKNLLHLEVFSCEDIKAFIDQTKEQAVRLPATEKTLVKILPHTPLITHVPGMNATNPPKANDASKEVGYGLLIPVSVLEALPAEKKIKAPVVMDGVTTYTQWWHLEGLLADAQGESIDGWFAEPNTTLYRHSPFEWEGFTFIEETGSNVDHYAAFLHAQENMTDEERKTYQPNIVTAGGGPTTQALYTTLDRNGDKKLPPEEISDALSKPWFAQPISQMVVKYESEWDYKPEKWDSLDELIGHSESAPHKEWVAEKARIEKLSWWKEVAGKEALSPDGKVLHIHPLGLIGSFDRKKRCVCNAVVKVTRWKTHFGPVVWGEGKLGDASQWSAIEAAGEVTAFEKKVITVMCENEGKINAVQSYDSELITAGAMQKTINPQGAGELPAQVARFKSLYPDEYVELFENQGWHLDLSSDDPKMYYQDSAFSNGEKLEGAQLKSKLRVGCEEATYGNVIQCKPVSVMACAIGSPSYVKLQILDFIKRLREVLLKTPNTYNFTVGQLFLSALGQATALDENVNRPSNVVKNLKKALDKFFLENPNVSKDITTWGSNHADYERKITEIYGPGRPGMTEPADRYNKIKAALNV